MPGLTNMEKAWGFSLSADETFQLKAVFEPEIVAVPPADAHRDLCVLGDGEIRHYGKKLISGQEKRIYIASRDCGLSWKTFVVDDDRELGASVRSPWSGKYITILNANNYNLLSYPALAGPECDGIYCLSAPNGPGDPNVTVNRISALPLLDLRQPIPLRGRKRWLCTAQVWHEAKLCPVVLRSDDDAATWRCTILESVAAHKVAWPHQGVRWQQYSCEPTLVELSTGVLLLLSRTSQDFHYQYFSHDGGATWTSPAPSPFHATSTMPTLLRLHDGRILLFWCNTQPLPELDHDTQPELGEDEKNGVWEDVFTNRDVCHAAISEDDGKSWIGFRELHLNAIRNCADFRERGAPSSKSHDTSVHQFQALEVLFGKVLLSFGQNPASRKMLLFDPDWLYETRRTEDFKYGMNQLSTQVYLKSLSGGFRGFAGHCSWNRTNGATMAPDPSGANRDVLKIARIEDGRLFSEVQGAVWNFPASFNGKLKIEIRIEGAGVRLSLCDRWFNPIDVTVRELAQFSFELSKDMLPENEWSVLEIEWNCAEKRAAMFINAKKCAEYAIAKAMPIGFSYLHIQSLAKGVDVQGTLVKYLEQASPERGAADKQ